MIRTNISRRERELTEAAGEIFKRACDEAIAHYGPAIALNALMSVFLNRALRYNGEAAIRTVLTDSLEVLPVLVAHGKMPQTKGSA
jgi:hypothetical protein